jgi:DNA polymerase
MNQRGIPVDPSEVNAVQYQVDRMKDRLNAKLPFLTGGAVVSATQVSRLTKWVANKIGRKVDSLNRLNVDALLSDDTVDGLVKDVLRIRMQVSKSSTAKLTQAQTQVCNDNTLKNSYVYHGAGTGRYAGRGMQPQNMPARGVKIDDPDAVINDFIHLDTKVLDLHYHVMETASSLLRSLIKAPPGFKFIVGDFTSIEAIVTPWIAGEAEVLNAIRKGLDLYIQTASRMFNKEYGAVVPGERQAGKVAVLACGFAGGKAALLRMAEAYGMTMSEELAEHYVQLFRKARPLLVAAWHLFNSAAKAALEMRAPVVPVNNIGVSVAFLKKGENLQMRLPSGRRINYPSAFLSYEETPWGEKRMGVSYYHQNPTTRVWEPRTMSGGNFFQNAVQGVARDILTENQLNLEDNGYPIFISTHDECGAMVPDTPVYRKDNFLKIMATQPAWATGLPIEASGWEGKRYRK